MLQQCKAANPKLTEFLCQKAQLEELIAYATLTPKNESHDTAHKYPFVAADILCSNKTIATALTEGGWASPKPDADGSGDEEASENKMVRDILTATNDKDKKETLVEKLDLNDDGNDSSSAPKKVNEPESEDAAAQNKNDWSLMDMLFNQFIATDKEQMLSVLCGYFNKVVHSLMTKESAKTLEYLLIRKEGQIFDGLMKHMQHHSLATLMIELLQTQIKPEDSRNKKMSMYNSDGSDADEQDGADQDEAKLTP